MKLENYKKGRKNKRSKFKKKILIYRLLKELSFVIAF
jgi:hypothetical protein